MKDHFGEKENKKQGNFSKKTGYMILIYKGAVFRIITKTEAIENDKKEIHRGFPAAPSAAEAVIHRRHGE